MYTRVMLNVILCESNVLNASIHTFSHVFAKLGHFWTLTQFHRIPICILQVTSENPFCNKFGWFSMCKSSLQIKVILLKSCGWIFLWKNNLKFGLVYASWLVYSSWISCTYFFLVAYRINEAKMMLQIHI